MFNSLYQFYYEWLFNGVAPSYLSTQGAEFATIVLAIITIVALVSLVFIPLKAIVNLMCRW